jgi:hypothetical protein
MDRRACFLLGVILVLTLSLIGYGDELEPINLRLHLKKGMRFTQRVSIEQQIVQQIQNRTHEMRQTMVFDYLQEVLNVDERENAAVRMTYKSIHIKQEGNDKRFEYHSEQTEGGVPTAAKGMAALIGAQLTVHISPKGEILRIDGLDLMLNQVAKKLKCSAGPQMEALKRMYSLNQMKSAMGQLIGPYPESPVHVGDIWSENTETQHSFPMAMDNFYKLKERRDGRLFISLSSIIKSLPNAASVQIGSLRLYYNISGYRSGSMIVGERTGLVLREEINQEFRGDITTLGLQETSAGTWPISVRTHLIREIIN